MCSSKAANSKDDTDSDNSISLVTKQADPQFWFRATTTWLAVSCSVISPLSYFLHLQILDPHGIGMYCKSAAMPASWPGCRSLSSASPQEFSNLTPLDGESKRLLTCMLLRASSSKVFFLVGIVSPR